MRRGFSFLEALLVLAVLGLVLLLTAPRLDPQAQALRQAGQALQQGVYLTRLEALRQNQRAGLDLLPQGEGFFLFLDQDLDRRYTPGADPVVRSLPFPGRVRVDREMSQLGNLPLLFDPRGVPAKPIAATLVLRSGEKTLRVVVAQTGRVRLE